MAARWMQAKVAKMKRDGMAATRGPFDRFKDEPRKVVMVQPRAAGWYVTGDDKREACGTYRGAPRSFGPFATQTEARRFGRAMFQADTFKTFQVEPPKREERKVRAAPLGDDVMVMCADYRAKQEHRLEIAKATREALGHNIGLKKRWRALTA